MRPLFGLGGRTRRNWPKPAGQRISRKKPAPGNLRHSQNRSWSLAGDLTWVNAGRVGPCSYYQPCRIYGKLQKPKRIGKKDMDSRIRWESSETDVLCRVGQDVIFRDAIEHWRNAVLRLLNLDESSGRAWIEAVAAESLAAVTRGSAQVFACPATVISPPTLSESISGLGESFDRVWFGGLRDDPSIAVFGSGKVQHGILFGIRNGVWARVAPIEYEEPYFEGNQLRIGYSSYSEQAGWRLEKAARQVRQIRGLASYIGRELRTGIRVLDIGSGYGYFRKAAGDLEWVTDGVEISRHAAAIAKETFGFETFTGSPYSFVEQHPEPVYDLVTMFDMIEHVEDPNSLMVSVNQILKPDGLCVVRTPNLLAIEADVFRTHYHSIKIDHLHYFSPSSLCHTMQHGGLTPLFMASESHLLRGFLGSALSAYAVTLRGSDLLSVAVKSTAEKPY